MDVEGPGEAERDLLLDPCERGRDLSPLDAAAPARPKRSGARVRASKRGDHHREGRSAHDEGVDANGELLTPRGERERAPERQRGDGEQPPRSDEIVA